MEYFGYLGLVVLGLVLGFALGVSSSSKRDDQRVFNKVMTHNGKAYRLTPLEK